jgi:poly(3-hydroxybutyrate) depolymerase
LLTTKTLVPFEDENGNSRNAKTFRAGAASSGIVHLDTVFKEADYKLAYAFCYIRSDKEQNVTGYFGSNDDAKIWVNRELVHQYPGARSCSPRQDTFTLRLKKGLNPILIKVCERWGDWAFVLEVFTDEFLAEVNQRPLARALRQIQDLDLCLKGYPNDTFPPELEAFPEVQWTNPYQVDTLLGQFPLRVRWFDSQTKEVSEPQGVDSYIAVIKGISPDGIMIRRAKRFYCSTASEGIKARSKTGMETEWRQYSTFIETALKEPFTQLVKQDSIGALAVSFLSEHQKEAKQTTLSPGKHAQSFDRLITKGQSCLYWLYLPKEYGQKNQKWPMILFLHGSFQQGRDLSKIGTPIPPNVKEITNDFPFVVVTPQCPDEYDAWPSDLLADLVDEAVAKYDVDARRVYVTGVSLGGRGSWSVAVDYPDRFAAIVPVCGTYDHPERISRIKDVPVWAFHGDQDKVVLFSDVQKMVEDLKACGGNVKFTIYQGAGHGISGRTYRNKELYEWLLQQRND